MTYRGRVKNGVVVLEAGTELREGMDVRVEPVVTMEGTVEEKDGMGRLQAGLLRFSGVVKDGPSDFARNHDHYLHGTPHQ